MLFLILREKKGLSPFCFLFTLFISSFSYSYETKTPLFLNTQQDISSDFSKDQNLINKAYLEYQADLAYLKASADFLDEELTSGLEHLKTALFFDPLSVFLKKRKAEIYKKEGLLTEAIALYKELELETEDEDKREIQKRLMECYALNQLNHLALEKNLSLAGHSGGDFFLSLQNTVLLMDQERWDDSLEKLKKLEQSQISLEERTQVILFQAYVLAEMGSRQLSLEMADRLFGLSAPGEALSLQVAGFYKSIEQEGKAISYLKKFQKEHGISKATADFLFDEFAVKGDWAQVFHYAENLEDLGEMEEKHYFYTAVYLADNNRHHLAVPYFKDLTVINPYHGYYHYLLGVSYRKSDQKEKASQAYQKVPAKSPYFLLSHLELADLWQKEGNYEESFSLLERLAFSGELRPKVVSVYARSLWEFGEGRKAIHVLNRALKEEPLQRDLLELRADYFRELDQLDLATKDLDRMLESEESLDQVLGLLER